MGADLESEYARLQATADKLDEHRREELKELRKESIGYAAEIVRLRQLIRNCPACREAKALDEV